LHQIVPENRITGVQFKNIPLKVSMGQMAMVADKIDLGVKIPAEKFKIPEGYTVKEQSQEQMQLPEGAPEEAETENK
jgi:hypothetical protein